MRTSRLAAVAALALLGPLSACGSMHPGTAASVGDTTISTATIDATTVDYCDAIRPQLEQGGQIVPLNLLRETVVSSLVLRAMGDGIAQEYAVKPGATYRDAVTRMRASTASLEDDVAASVVEVETAGAYLQDIVDAAATNALEADGVRVTPELVAAKGAEIMAAWPGAHDLTIDPRYGLAWREGRIANVGDDGGLSVAVSDVATRGAAHLADMQEAGGFVQPEWASDLPANERCG